MSEKETIKVFAKWVSLVCIHFFNAFVTVVWGIAGIFLFLALMNYYGIGSLEISDTFLRLGSAIMKNVMLFVLIFFLYNIFKDLMRKEK